MLLAELHGCTRRLVPACSMQMGGWPHALQILHARHTGACGHQSSTRPCCVAWIALYVRGDAAETGLSEGLACGGRVMALEWLLR